MGDVNDYRKYGLLRCFAKSGFRLGVCWMLTANDRRRDGGKTQYLQNPQRWRHHDPHLFDALGRLIASRRREVQAIQLARVLPRARFIPELLPDGPADRETYFALAARRIGAADLWFFDPDNGLEVPSTPYGARGSSKYLYWREVATTWNRGVSILVYQHWPRERRDAYTARRRRELRAHAPGAVVMTVRSPHVLFLLACQPQHRERIDPTVARVRLHWDGQLRAIV